MTVFLFSGPGPPGPQISRVGAHLTKTQPRSALMSECVELSEMSMNEVEIGSGDPSFVNGFTEVQRLEKNLR